MLLSSLSRLRWQQLALVSLISLVSLLSLFSTFTPLTSSTLLYAHAQDSSSAEPSLSSSDGVHDTSASSVVPGATGASSSSNFTESSSAIALSSSVPTPPGPTDFAFPCPAVPDTEVPLNTTFNDNLRGFIANNTHATLPAGTQMCFGNMDDSRSSLADSPYEAYQTHMNATGRLISCREANLYISDAGSQNKTGWQNYLAPPYKRGQYPPIAIVVSSAFGNVKTYFFPLLDAISLLQISRSHNETWYGYSVSTRVRLEIANSTSSIVVSEPRHRFGPDCRYVVTFWTAIVTLSQGEPTSIDWEDDDTTCSNEAAIDGNCGVPLDSCAIYASSNSSVSASPINNGTADCDLKIYVAWKGTDSAGNVMTSHSKTIANFRRWSFNSLYNSASAFTDSGLNVLPVVPCKVDPSTDACETQDAGS